MTSPQGFMLVRYFEGGRFVGERKEYCYTTPTPQGPRSCFYPHEAFFCPQCGELWGRAIKEYHPGYSPLPREQWTMQLRACPKHGNGYFLELVPFDHLRSCSKDLLRREVELLLYHKEF